MTPQQQALIWAIEDVEELGYDPMARLALTKALTRLYHGLIGDTPWRRSSKPTSRA